jgi:hypothetical protein
MDLSILSSRLNYTELGLALRSATTVKTLGMSGTTASNPLDVCGAVVAICIGNVLKQRIQNLRQAAAIAP